jgi:hypothetical protein
MVIDFDLFYIDETDLRRKPGWYFWLINEVYESVRDPCGPWETKEEAIEKGNITLDTYYGKDYRNDH